jgi:hypothetical protein
MMKISEELINLSVRQKAQITDNRTQPVVITEQLHDHQRSIITNEKTVKEKIGAVSVDLC